MRKVFLVSLLAVFSIPALADDLDAIGSLSQQQFLSLSKDLAAGISYKGVQPAEPYGIIGFDVGVGVSTLRIENSDAWGAASGDASSNLPLTRISVNKGLPLGFDVGAFLAKAPGSNVDVVGAQLRYALIEGGVAMPAVGLRAAMSRLNGVDDLDLDTRSLDLSISKGLGPVTPYAGIGRVWSEATPDAATGLAAEDFAQTKKFIGARFSLLALQFSVEADQTGDAETYSLKLGFGF